MTSSTQDDSESLLRPALGTILFVLVVPGTVIGWVPFLLSRWRLQPPFFGLESSRWLGVIVFLCGVPVFFDFLVRFVRDGRGTPAPIAPTRRLVVTGAFRYVRNPGYIGVLSLLVGQALFLGSAAVLLYAACVAVAFHVFVLFYEEPTLRRQFGEEYEDYCRRVQRWIPRRPRE